MIHIIKAIDPFGGIGGFRLGLKQALKRKIKFVWSCENDKFPRKVYRYQFGEFPQAGDIREVRPKDIPEHDLLCAGTPCQDFSQAGKRAGLEGSRGTLFYEVFRLAKGCGTPYLFIENVRGLLSNAKGWDFARLLFAMDECGYDCQWQVLNSETWVPQNRERVFIIGHLRGERRPEVFPFRQDGGVPDKKVGRKQKEGKRVRGQDSIASTIDARYGALRNAGETYIQAPEIARAVTGGAHSAGLHSDMTLINVVNDESREYRVYDPNGVSVAIAGGAGGCGAKTGPYLVDDQDVKSALIQSRGLETKEDDVSHCIKGGDGGSSKNHVYIQNLPHGYNDGFKKKHPNIRASATQYNELLVKGGRIRRLTPIECERCQSFPDDWTKWGIDEKSGKKVLMSDSRRYKMIGNAVTIDVIKTIGHRLGKVFK